MVQKKDKKDDTDLNKPLLNYDGESLDEAILEGEPCKKCGMNSITRTPLTRKKAILTILTHTVGDGVEVVTSYELMNKLFDKSTTDLKDLTTKEKAYILGIIEKSDRFIPYAMGFLTEFLDDNK